MKQVLLGLALMLAFPVFALAQDGVEVALEAYIVTTVVGDDGSKSEEFQQADAARPGQVVEYRVVVTNVSGDMLPAASVAVTGPVPANTMYLDGTATEDGEAYRTEFSADGGETFSQPPVMMLVTNDAGEEEEVIADPELFSSVRWTFLEPLNTDDVRTLVYRVEVR